jgi:hypothetical protein
MRLKRTFFGFTFGLIVLLIACGTSSANGLITLEFDFDMTMQYPVDVNQNPTTDLTKIGGFCMQGELLSGGVKIADLSGCWMLQETPFDPTRLYDDITVSGLLVVQGVGQCTLTGHAIGMAVGEDPTSGDLAARLVTRLTDCTGGLAGFEGLVDGGGTSNLYDQTFTSDQYKMKMYLQYLPQ